MDDGFTIVDPVGVEAALLVVGSMVALVAFSAECVILATTGSGTSNGSAATDAAGFVLLVSGLACLGGIIHIASRGGDGFVKLPLRTGLATSFRAIKQALTPGYLRVASRRLGWNAAFVNIALGILLI